MDIDYSAYGHCQNDCSIYGFLEYGMGTVLPYLCDDVAPDQIGAYIEENHICIAEEQRAKRGERAVSIEVNSEFIVDWLGCGCPKVDVETGEMIHDYFSANDFTAYFWLAVSLCVTVASAFLTKLLPKNKVWLKILYVVLMLVASLFISYQFIQVMMWN